MRDDDVYRLPGDLPVPENDGATDHLPGSAVPPVRLPGTSGKTIGLDVLTRTRTVLYAYPRTGRPDEPPLPGWNAIPGARGGTPQACAFRDHHDELRRLTLVLDAGRVEHVFYPVFPPDAHAGEVVRWLAARPTAG